MYRIHKNVINYNPTILYFQPPNMLLILMNLNFCQKIYYLSCRYEYKELKKEIEEFINTRLNNNSFPTEKNVKNNENYQTSQVDPAKE